VTQSSNLLLLPWYCQACYWLVWSLWLWCWATAYIVAGRRLKSRYWVSYLTVPCLPCELYLECHEMHTCFVSGWNVFSFDLFIFQSGYIAAMMWCLANWKRASKNKSKHRCFSFLVPPLPPPPFPVPLLLSYSLSLPLPLPTIIILALSTQDHSLPSTDYPNTRYIVL